MTENNHGMHDDLLETYFDAARAAPPPVPQDLLARIQADAAAQQPKPTVGWRGWVAALGGAPAMGGLITAACVGVWIGVAPPAQLPDVGGFVLGYDSGEDSNTSAAFGWDIEEG